ncbi:MAG: right-handed parallel beta-helix repeat-containing protein, partial [Candidatus Thorarchaeota archaeon]
MESRVVVPAIGLVLILLVSLPMNLSSSIQSDSIISPVIDPVDNTMTSYTPHAMIRTNGDTELYNLAIADNWTGYGNLTHPWIIEGYSITAQRPIEIGQTDYIFTIRDCLLTGTDPAIEWGIRLLDTEYSRIENCIISNVGTGIEFWNVRWGTIQNCTIFGCGDFGIYARYGQECNIYDCVVRDNPEVGINIHESEDMTVRNNIVYGNGHEGILVDHESGWTSDYLTLQNNTIRNNGGSTYPGLVILDTHHVTATDMTIYSNHIGVLVQDSNGFSLTDSQIYQNSDIGVLAHQANSGTFRNNTVRDNGDSGFVLD